MVLSKAFFDRYNYPNYLLWNSNLKFKALQVKNWLSVILLLKQNQDKMAMRIRKTNAIIGSVLGLGLLFMVYLVIDTYNYEDLDAQKDELNALESKLRGLENELLVNQKTIDQIKDTVQELQQEQVIIREESKAIRAKGKSPVNKTFASIQRNDFEFARQKPLQCDIRMADVYDKIPFDNPDGGVWKQGKFKVDELVMQTNSW